MKNMIMDILRFFRSLIILFTPGLYAIDRIFEKERASPNALMLIILSIICIVACYEIWSLVTIWHWLAFWKGFTVAIVSLVIDVILDYWIIYRTSYSLNSTTS